MLKIVILILLAFFAGSAAAQECTPVVQLQRHALTELHISPGAIFMIEGRAEAATYLDAIGAPIPPADSAPKGLFVVEGKSVAYIGIVEQSDCVRYSLAVPLVVHIRALAKVMKGA